MEMLWKTPCLIKYWPSAEGITPVLIATLQVDLKVPGGGSWRQGGDFAAAGISTLITKQECSTYVFRVLLCEPDLTPLLGILLTMTEEPLGIRPSSSEYSEWDRWRKWGFRGEGLAHTKWFELGFWRGKWIFTFTKIALILRVTEKSVHLRFNLRHSLKQRVWDFNKKDSTPSLSLCFVNLQQQLIIKGC